MSEGLRSERARLIDRIDERDATISHLTTERDALLIALHDAIRRPMGVVPASADQFYSPAMADRAQAIRALKSPKPQED